MTNIIQFPTRHVPTTPTKKGKTKGEETTTKPRRARKPKATGIQAAADTIYFITTLHEAANIAAYVYKDKKGVDMILAEIARFYAAGISYDHLSLEFRAHCRLYLNEDANPRYLEDVTKAFEFIYG